MYRGLVVAGLVLGLVSLGEAAFLPRLETAPGSGVFQAYFDDQLNLTWTADANINGLDNWANHVAWAGSLDIDGVTGWRLPNMDRNGDDTIVSCGADQAACMDNEYGHLFNYGVGTILGSGVTAAAPGVFSNVQAFFYWSGTEFAPLPASRGASTSISVARARSARTSTAPSPGPCVPETYPPSQRLQRCC